MAEHHQEATGKLVTVTDLMRNFAEACRRLTPVMDVALIPWSDEEQYDNWERVAEVLFTSLVSEPCEYAAVGEDGLQLINTAPYGFDIPPDGCNAHLAAVHGEEAPRRVIRLSTVHRPFDHVLVKGSAGAESILLSEVSFLFVVSSPEGQPNVVEQVDLTL